jgi:hypothetical protein
VLKRPMQNCTDSLIHSFPWTWTWSWPWLSDEYGLSAFHVPLAERGGEQAPKAFWISLTQHQRTGLGR